MTIKQIAEKCDVEASRWDAGGVVEYLYTESDVSKMLRYVAMEVANKTAKTYADQYDSQLDPMYDDAIIKEIVDQVLGEE